MSGGEKARLLLWLATYDGPNLLILDEPTNHLDIDSRSALIHALNDFKGAVILIAHDRHLIEATMDRLWKVGNGTVLPYDGDLDSYRFEVLATAQQTAKAISAAPQKSKSSQRKAEADRRAATAPLRKKIRQTEEFTEKLVKQLKKLDAELAAPELYQTKPDEAARKAKERAATARKLEETETLWLRLHDELERAMNESKQGASEK